MPRSKRRRTYSTLAVYFRETGDTQQALAARVGCKQAHISRIVTGQRMPRIALALKLARATRVPLDALARVVVRRRPLKRRGRR